MTPRLATLAVRAYRRLPVRPACRCNPGGRTCSERGLHAAKAGAGLAVLLGIALACLGQTPDYNPLCGTTNQCTGVGKSQPTEPAQPAPSGSPCPAGSWDAGAPNC